MNKSVEQSKMTKAEKGRLKKLRRMYTNMDGGKSAKSLSGITSVEKANELRYLLSKSLQKKIEDVHIGPSISLAKRKATDDCDYYSPSTNSTTSPVDHDDTADGNHVGQYHCSWTHTEGSNHRDLMQSLVFYDGYQDSTNYHKKSGKKRKNNKKNCTKNNDEEDHDTLPFKIPPSWSVVHHPALTQSVVVIEICIEQQTGESSSISESLVKSENISSILPSSCLQEKSSSNESNPSTKTEQSTSTTLSKLLSEQGYKGHKATPLQVQLFQGNVPRHTTDVLMYIEDPRVSKTKNGTCLDEKSSHFDVVKVLSSMILTDKEMKDEHYPQLEDITSSQKKMKTDSDTITGTNFKTVDLLINTGIRIISESIDQAIDGHSLPFTHSQAISVVKDLKVNVVQGEGMCSSDGYICTCIPRADSAAHHSEVEAKRTIVTPHIYGLDCEMVDTRKGKELARVTLVRWECNMNKMDDYQVVIDTLVKPYSPILNYLTQYSGVTAEMMKDVDVRLEDVQATLACIICEDDIVVGHSMENDFHALRMVHKNVIDTSSLFRGNNRRKYALRHLASFLLEKDIQGGNKHRQQKDESQSTGHCSEEDASTALALAIQRAYNGPSFQMPQKRQGRINMLDFISTSMRQWKYDSHKRPHLFSDSKKPVVCIGPNDWIKEHCTGAESSCHAITCEDIESPSVNALSSFLRPGPRRASLIWAKLMVNPNDTEKANKKIDEILCQIINSVSTLALVLYQGDFKRAKILSQQRRVAKEGKSSLPWSSNQEKQWTDAMETTRSCEAIWISYNNTIPS